MVGVTGSIPVAPTKIREGEFFRRTSFERDVVRTNTITMTRTGTHI
jgi:hypothetical protein